MDIFTTEPQSWQELQKFVGQLFSEIGYEVEVSKTVELVRGKKEIDVFVTDHTNEYPTTFLVECKFWNKPVNQEVVHAFQTVMEAFGTNYGFIVSKSGFQSGAITAAKNTNINLVSLEELESKFYKKWTEGMVAKYIGLADILFPYWDPSGGKMPGGGPISWVSQQLLDHAYNPIISLGPWDKESFQRNYPISIPILDDEFAITDSEIIKNDREYFDFIECNKEKAIRHYKKLYRE